ncbi:hypothetical protein BD414DRAFT_66983 [Trametes punicea]|nr:hypothetical protein BD414DRAFT_66983 [Trametes punicea]
MLRLLAGRRVYSLARSSERVTVLESKDLAEGTRLGNPRLLALLETSYGRQASSSNAASEMVMVRPGSTIAAPLRCLSSSGPSNKVEGHPSKMSPDIESVSATRWRLKPSDPFRTSSWGCPSKHSIPPFCCAASCTISAKRDDQDVGRPPDGDQDSSEGDDLWLRLFRFPCWAWDFLLIRCVDTSLVLA